MSPSTASIPFMLRHELRLHWRTLGFKMRSGVAAVIVLASLHLLALPIAMVLNELPQLARGELLLAWSIALLCAFVTMVSTSLVSVVKLIYERRDFDLLLSSPIDPRAILVSRIIGIMASGIGLGILLVGPFANMFALFGHKQYLALYPIVVCVGLLAATASLLLAEGLFRLVGVRNARLFAQTLGLGLGAALLVAANLQHLTDNVTRKAVDKLQAFAVGLPDVNSWVWLPARAALGEAAPLAALMLLAIGLFALATFGLAKSFLDNAGAAGGGARVRASAARKAHPFRSGTIAIMRRKELRLMTRDPYLLAQVMYQLVTLAPIVFMLWKASANWPALVWVSLVLAAGIISANLSWLTVSAEDSPDLLAISPIAARDVLRAKVEAALLPVAALLAPPLAVAMALDPWLGLTLLICCVSSALSTALINLRYRKPAKRSEFNKRVQGSWLAWVLEFVVAGLWTGVAGLMLISSYFAAAPALFLLAVIGISAYWRRIHWTCIARIGCPVRRLCTSRR